MDVPQKFELSILLGGRGDLPLHVREEQPLLACG